MVMSAAIWRMVYIHIYTQIYIVLFIQNNTKPATHGILTPINTYTHNTHLNATRSVE